MTTKSAKNVIEGLEEARWGGGHRENSVVGALEAALRALGEEIPYDFLLGVSGGAFKLQVAQPSWCPSAPHANSGFRLYPALDAALPYEFVPLEKEQGDGDSQRAPEALMESIDRGVPGFYSKEEESLVVGYDKEGQEVLLRPYAAREKGYVPHSVDELLSDWGGFQVLKKKDTPAKRSQSLIRSLEIAVELANTPAYKEGAAEGQQYASGFTAYEFWIASLRDGTPREGPQMLGNRHGFFSLIDAREAAASYLASIAGEFEGDAAKHLTSASELYREIVAILTPRHPMEFAPMPWFPAAKDWNQDRRNEQADVLAEALAVERRAIAEIEDALEALKRRPRA